MPRTRGKFTLMNSDKESESFTEDDNENDRKDLDGEAKKRCLSKKEAIAVFVGFVIVSVALVLFIIIAVATTQHPITKSDESSSPWLSKRLPASTVPEHYTIHLRVDMQVLRVSGTSQIDVLANDPTSYIVLHAKSMSISVTSMKQNGKEVIIARTFDYKENDYFVLELAQAVSGRVNIDLRYNYSLSADLSGFYNSSYVSSSGEKKTMACTQFEPTDARKAFPCFDEPGMKALFTLSITHDSSMKAVSNMPCIGTTSAGNMVKTDFNTTVKMSTYLVAFVVSEFVNVTNHTNSGVRVSVWSRSGVINQTHYALDIATKVLTYYEQSFHIPYPLPKLDLFAIPDFAAGAMENWGLVTYRETALLYNPESSPLKSKQWVASVIAHELAHQWFGNLVTMKWWDDLWLNEGFASFVEYIGADNADNSVNMQEQFVIGDFRRALDLDSLLSSHPVEAVVTDPDEINSQFDDISYDKGSSLLRMLSAYMGYDNFLKGITSYLRKYQFGNARTDDLWNSIGEISPHAKAMMNTWTKQAGYPVISVDEVGKLTQHRFFLVQPENTSQIPTSEFRYVWKVPMKYVTQKSNEHVEVDTDATSVSWTKDDGWIKLNVLQTSFVRVNYDVQNWIRLTEHLITNLNTTSLGPEDRAGLIEDAFALSDAGQLDIGIALNLSLYLVKERHYVPWHTAIAWFNRIDTRLRYTPAYGDYKAFVRFIIHPALQDILHNLTAMETNLAVYLRSDLYATATQYGCKNVTAMLVLMFNNFYHHNVSVNPNLKQVVYMTGIAEGDEPEWNFLWGIYKTSSDPIEQQLILYALSRTRQLWLLARYLQYSVRDVRSQDTLRVIQYVAQNEHGLSLSWNFLRLHWDYLLKRHGIGSFGMRRLIHTFAKAFTSKFRQNEFQAFFGMSGNVGGSRGVQQGYEYIKSNLHWFEHTYQTTSSWLADKRKVL